MSTTQQVLAAWPRVSVKGPRHKRRHRHLRGSDFKWAIAFIVPYAAIFFALVVYLIAYALWMASEPSLYADLIAGPLYLSTIVNTLLFVGVGVNVKMFLALLLSGFFLRRRRWIRALLAIYILPWALAAAQACISFHWMLIGEAGLVDGVLSALLGIEGPNWFNNRWLGLGSNIVAYIWKWMPFWTVIFLAARIRIPRDIYDAAEVDGATGYRRFVHITFPLLGNLYLICTLLSTLWTLGDFTTVYLVSGGGPAGTTGVLATLGFHYAFDASKPARGVAVVIWSLLPVYNMLLIAHDPEEGEIEFSGNLYPPEVSFEGFWDVVTQEARYLEDFWHQFGNSLYIGLLTMVLTVLIGSLASFAVTRMRLAKGSLLTNAALLTYAIPASFLIVPYYRIMHLYGLSDNLLAVIAAQVSFATPFAILVMQLYGSLIPFELDDAARVDGASAVQLYLRIYLPLMAPALAVVAVYALLLAWNDYLHQSVLLSVRNMTVSVMQGQLLADVDAPWNAMMAAAIIYVLPPIALLFALRRYVAAGLTIGEVKG